MSQPELLIRASRILAAFSKVSVTALKDVPEVKLATTMLSSKRGGSSFKLPLWLALSLEELGFVRVEDGSDVSWLVRAQWRESVQKGDNLSRLPPAFYVLSARLLQRVKEKPEYPKYEAALDDLISLRLRKIVNLAMKGARDRTIISAMSPEERALFRLISVAVREWREMVKEV